MALTAAVVPVATAPAQTPTQSTDGPASHTGPAIRFAETEFDFGRISQGEVTRHEFVFTNTGTATLEITAVQPGCGCTTAGNWDKQVAPGQTGVIPLQFNSGSFHGKVTKATTVMSNVEGQSRVVLTLTATIWKAFQVLPASAYFRTFAESPTNETKVIRIVSELAEPVTLSGLQNTNDAFQTELKTIQPGKEFELHITITPPFRSASPQTMVSLQTSSKEAPRINILAQASVVQPVTLIPERIMLPPGPLPATRRAVVTIRNNSEHALSLSDARVNVPAATLQVREAQPGRYFTLTVDFPAGFELKPEHKIEITAKSNLPKFPLITVPVVPVQPPATP